MVYHGEMDGVACPPNGEIVIVSDQAWPENTPSRPITKENLGRAAKYFAESRALPGTQNMDELFDADGNQIAVLERAMTPEELGL